MKKVYADNLERMRAEARAMSEEVETDYFGNYEKAFADAAGSLWSDGMPPFQWATPTGESHYEDPMRGLITCGCLTQVKHNCKYGNSSYSARAATEEIQKIIENDPLIPTTASSLTETDVLHLIEVQEKIDALYPGRTESE